MNYNCILVSHNNRIQCLLDKIFESKKKIRFQNGCVLKLVINNSSINLSLLFEGGLSESDSTNTSKKYYSTDKNNDKYTQFVVQPLLNEEYTKCLKNLRINSLNNYTYNKNTNTYTFYIVRHGIAQHNVSNFVNKHLFSDPKLVNENDPYIKNAGIQINNDLNGDAYIFVSDLKRTMQTASIIAEQITKFKPNEFIVLPCAHELNKDKGDCDADSGYRGNENSTSCTTKLINTTTRDPVNCKKVNSYNLNWELYLAFYNNSVRGEFSFSSKLHCRNTSAISLILFYLHNSRLLKYDSLNKYINSSNTNTNTNSLYSDSYIPPFPPADVLFGGKSRKRKSITKKTHRSYSKNK